MKDDKKPKAKGPDSETAGAKDKKLPEFQGEPRQELDEGIEESFPASALSR